ncbi:MAG: hypothetical protein AAF558_15700, partial [Verrucomicrobiota bacterium]
LGTSLALIAKVGSELLFLQRIQKPAADMLTKSAHLMWGPLRHVVLARVVLGFVGLMLLPVLPWLGVLTILISEGCERYQFFRATVAWRMPGI